MTDETVRTLLRDDVTASEPAFAMDVAATKGRGRRALLMRRATASVGVVALAAGATVGVSLLRGEPDRTPSYATTISRDDFDPAVLIADMRQAVAVATSGTPAFATSSIDAYDDQGYVIHGADRDKASGWDGSFSWTPTHLFDLALSHSRGLAEGNARKNCADDVEAGSYLSCDVTTGADGSVVISRTAALVKLHGQGWRTADPSKVDPQRLWFLREVKVIRGYDYVGYASEYVKAPTLDDATTLWYLSGDRLEAAADDPDLVFPEPPIGANGCAWIVPEHADQISCGKSP